MGMGHEQRTVAVLMSAYNGGKYIREQIDSILEQEGVGLTLYIRDDGSSDTTPDILGEYAAKDTRVRFINPDERINLGVCGSFLMLVRYALKDDRGTEYFSFADQDDFWRSDKLKRAVEQLQNAGSSKHGALYISNKTIADAGLSVIREEHMRIQNDLFDAFWPNVVAGCTMVMDRKLAGCAVRYIPGREHFHDAWVLRIARLIGSGVVFDRYAGSMLHRQHGDNTFGFDDGGLYHDDAPVWKKVIPSIKKAPNHKRQNVIRLIWQHYGHLIPRKNRGYVKAILDYDRNPLSALLLITAPMAFRRGFKLWIVWVYRILFKQI